MSPTRSQLGGVLVTAVLLGSTLAGAPVAAADSPESAINEFFDIAATGEFDRIAEVVCAADQGAMREAFDLGEQLGLGDAEMAQALRFQIEDRSFEVISQDGDTATVAVTATMFMDVAEDQTEAIVRAMMEADLGPDDPPVSDDDVEMMMGFMGSALNQVQAIDEEVTVVREDGTWLVCGGLIDEPEGPTVEPIVSSEGMCGIATPDEISAVGSLEYDSANGFGEYCLFSTADYDSFHTLSVSLGTGQDAAELAPFLGADQELTVVGSPAFATAPDAAGNQLLVQVGDDLLQVSIFVDEGTEIDWLADLTAISELLIPRIPEARVAIAGPTPEPTPLPTPEISLCEGLPLETLNAQTGLGLDEAQGDRYYCGYNQLDGEPGWHVLSVSLSELTLEDYRTWLLGAEDVTISGQPALIHDVQVVVELPGGAWTLAVSGFVDDSDESVSMTTAELLTSVAEQLTPTVVVPASTLGSSDGFDSGTPDTETQDSGFDRPLCDYFDLDAINALGMLEFNVVSEVDDASCSVSQDDFEKGFATVSVTAAGSSVDDLRTYYPDAAEISVAGRSGFVTDFELYVDSGIGTLSFFAILPVDENGDVMDAAAVMSSIAELVVPAIEADAE